MFEPKIFPIAISLLPLIAAVTLVTNSGKLVPIASIVKLINFSLKFKFLAIETALFTVKSPPIFNPIIPNITKIILLAIGCNFCGLEFVSVFFLKWDHFISIT